jgi:hypothetical protein
MRPETAVGDEGKQKESRQLGPRPRGYRRSAASTPDTAKPMTPIPRPMARSVSTTVRVLFNVAVCPGQETFLISILTSRRKANGFVRRRGDLPLGLPGGRLLQPVVGGAGGPGG